MSTQRIPKISYENHTYDFSVHTLRSMILALFAFTALGCKDITGFNGENWKDLHHKTCTQYEVEGICSAGKLIVDFFRPFGAQDHCCACGKGRYLTHIFTLALPTTYQYLATIWYDPSPLLLHNYFCSESLK